MAGGVAQGVGPEFKPQYHQKRKKYLNHRSLSWTWSCMPVIPFQQWRQEDHKFKASVGYIETLSQKNKNRTNPQNKKPIGSFGVRRQKGWRTQWILEGTKVALSVH
jgi:hypothetical protein